MKQFAHIFFMDGVGLGGPDPAVNPFVTANLPFLTDLFGESWYLHGNGRHPITTSRASLVSTDATLGIPGRPQSATGQATILTGRNIPQLVGEHYGPKPNPAVADVVRAGTLFQEVVTAGGRAALLTPYPQRYFEGIESGRRLLSAVPLAATSAGLPLMTADNLRRGEAISPDFTNQGWRAHLGYADMPELTLAKAGERIAAVAATHQFSFFEHWPSDQIGHRGTLAEAVTHLELLDTVIGPMIEAWDDDHGLLIITSDHGNIEEKNQRQHTLNPVPTILVGPHHAELAAQLHNLTHIAHIVRQHLALQGIGQSGY